MIHIVQEVIPTPGCMDQMDGSACWCISIDDGGGRRCIGSQHLKPTGRGHAHSGRDTGRRDTDRMLWSESPPSLSGSRQADHSLFLPATGQIRQKHQPLSLSLITLTSLFGVRMSGPLSGFADRLLDRVRRERGGNGEMVVVRSRMQCAVW